MILVVLMNWIAANSLLDEQSLLFTDVKKVSSQMVEIGGIELDSIQGASSLIYSMGITESRIQVIMEWDLRPLKDI